MTGNDKPYQSDNFWTSHHNWASEIELLDDIAFHDTTFRDGE